jgi:hypothetical protein
MPRVQNDNSCQVKTERELAKADQRNFKLKIRHKQAWHELDAPSYNGLLPYEEGRVAIIQQTASRLE